MKPISRKRRRKWRRQLKRNPVSSRGLMSTMDLMTKLQRGRWSRPKLTTKGKLDLTKLFKLMYELKREHRDRAASLACNSCGSNNADSMFGKYEGDTCREFGCFGTMVKKVLASPPVV